MKQLFRVRSLGVWGHAMGASLVSKPPVNHGSADKATSRFK